MDKFALLVGTGQHIHNGDFYDLSTTRKDVESVQQVLQDPEVGAFPESNISVLIDRPRQEIEEAIEQLFTSRKKDELLLFYFSGHGVKDLNRNLYLITQDSRKNNNNQIVKSTAISARVLHEYMNDSFSQRQVIILDCCYSGLFPKDLKIKGDDSLPDISSSLGGKGRAILTASSATQFAFEKEGSELSVYTSFLVEGLENGYADQDGDGYISPDDLHEYIKEKVKESNLEMTPEFYPVQEGHKILLAKARFSLPQINYQNLSGFLEKKQWEEADQETKNLFLEVAGRTEDGELKDEDIDNFHCSVINSISQLWKEYSNGHFGFEVQREIWMSQDISNDWRKFMVCVGWLEQNLEGIPAVITYNFNAPRGHLPSCFSYIFRLFSRIDVCQSKIK